MELGKENAKTFSVRQLANLFGRSEQTVRRWKDKGINGAKLAAGLDCEEEAEPAEEGAEGRAGSLVFTVEAVRTFVDANPSLLDKAAPELELLLYGRKRGFFSRLKSAGTSLDLDESEDEPVKSPGVPVEGQGLCGKGDYLYNLLLAREKEVKTSIETLQRELEQIQQEKARLTAGEEQSEDQ